MRELYLLVPLTACVASTMLLAIFLAGRTEHRANRPAAVLMAGAIVWSFCEVLWNAAPDAAQALAWVRRSSVGWVAIGPLALQVLGSATGSDRAWLRRALPWLYAVCGIFLVVDLTTPWIHPGVVRRSWGWSYRLGPAYAFFYVFTMGCLATGLVLALRALRSGEVSPAERQQTRLLAVGIFVPMAVASLTDGILPFAGFHPPRFGTVSLVALAASVAWSFHRYGHSLLAPRAFAGEILEALHDGVALLHLDGRVRSANGALARLLATEAAALEGTGATAFLPELPLEPPREVRDVETELRTEDGPVPVAFSTLLLRDKAALTIGLVLVVRDLREVVALRRRLVTSGRLAAVGELAAGIAHEINNPVSYVRTNLGVLRHQLEDRDGTGPGPAPGGLTESRELIEESLEGIDRIAAVVRDLKGFGGGEQVQRETVDLNALLELLLRVLSPHLRFGARVEANLSEVPPVAGSPQELKQVFTNLLLNAGQALEGGGTIRVTTRREADRVIVVVEDDGRGIAPEVLERVFDPFFTTRQGRYGSGLGLAVAWEVVRQHGGEIAVESTPGRGTRVTVRLPAAS